MKQRGEDRVNLDRMPDQVMAKIKTLYATHGSSAQRLATVEALLHEAQTMWPWQRHIFLGRLITIYFQQKNLAQVQKVFDEWKLASTIGREGAYLDVISTFLNYRDCQRFDEAFALMRDAGYGDSRRAHLLVIDRNLLTSNLDGAWQAFLNLRRLGGKLSEDRSIEYLKKLWHAERFEQFFAVATHAQNFCNEILDLPKVREFVNETCGKMDSDQLKRFEEFQAMLRAGSTGLRVYYQEREGSLEVHQIAQRALALAEEGGVDAGVEHLLNRGKWESPFLICLVADLCADSSVKPDYARFDLEIKRHFPQAPLFSAYARLVIAACANSDITTQCTLVSEFSRELPPPPKLVRFLLDELIRNKRYDDASALREHFKVLGIPLTGNALALVLLCQLSAGRVEDVAADIELLKELRPIIPATFGLRLLDELKTIDLDAASFVRESLGFRIGNALRRLPAEVIFAIEHGASEVVEKYAREILKEISPEQRLANGLINNIFDFALRHRHPECCLFIAHWAARQQEYVKIECLWNFFKQVKEAGKVALIQELSELQRAERLIPQAQVTRALCASLVTLFPDFKARDNAIERELSLGVHFRALPYVAKYFCSERNRKRAEEILNVYFTRADKNPNRRYPERVFAELLKIECTLHRDRASARAMLRKMPVPQDRIDVLHYERLQQRLGA